MFSAAAIRPPSLETNETPLKGHPQWMSGDEDEISAMLDSLCGQG